MAVATAEVEKVAARVAETEAATGAVRAVEMAVETEVAATVVEESAAAMEVEATVEAMVVAVTAEEMEVVARGWWKVAEGMEAARRRR